MTTSHHNLFFSLFNKSLRIRSHRLSFFQDKGGTADAFRRVVKAWDGPAGWEKDQEGQLEDGKDPTN